MPRYEPFDWYATPLYYDIVFDADTDQEARFLEGVYDRFATAKGRRALEPACGSGRLLTAIAQRGFTVAGVDLEPGMLAFAHQRLAEAGAAGTLLEAPMEDFQLDGRFDLAWCLVSSFKYLQTEAAAAAHLRLMADHLDRGGVYVLGLHLTDDLDLRADHERWVAQRDGIQVTCNIHGFAPDPEARTEQVRARLAVRASGKPTRYYETHWTFRTYTFDQLKALLAREPRFEHVATYNFHHDLDQPIPFDGTWLDNVLVLRRR